MGDHGIEFVEDRSHLGPEDGVVLREGAREADGGLASGDDAGTVVEQVVGDEGGEFEKFGVEGLEGFVALGSGEELGRVEGMVLFGVVPHTQGSEHGSPGGGGRETKESPEGFDHAGSNLAGRETTGLGGLGPEVGPGFADGSKVFARAGKALVEGEGTWGGGIVQRFVGRKRVGRRETSVCRSFGKGVGHDEPRVVVGKTVEGET
jgi:hypothetical protein